MKLLTSHKIGLTYSSILLIVCGLVYFAYQAGYASSFYHFESYLEDFKPIRRGGEQYKYINPLVGTDSPSAFSVGYYMDLKEEIEDKVKAYKNKGMVDYAIYYRQLNSAVWFGFNEDEEFFPASLLKLPIALASYKQGEANPAFLDSRILFTQAIKDISLSRNNETTNLVVGNYYSVRDLIRIMIIDSDNSARDLITTVLNPEYIEMLYEYLHIEEPSQSKSFKISTNNYSLFFRMMYSSTFINEDHSEELLEILTKTVFPYALIRDLPSSIPVSHKYGVFNLPKNNDGIEMQELHDCGIVYRFDNPYLLCMMTQGPDQKLLADFMATVSKTIFEYSPGSQ